MNNYILEYYQAIKDGSIIVGEYIRLWYEYIVKGLKRKSFFYDQKKANKSIKFVETFCHHHEGELAPNLIKLELWQKAFLCQEMRDRWQRVHGWNPVRSFHRRQ